MKLLFASAVMALFAAAPGAADSSVGGVVDTYDSQDIESASSSSFDMYSQDSASSASASSFSEDMEMMDSEDELVNNNMFVTLGNRNSRDDNCDGIGYNTCSRRNCEWTCRDRRRRDGCCVNVDDRRRRPTRRPIPRPHHHHHHPNRRPTRRPTPRPNNDRDVTFDNGLGQGRKIARNLWRRMGSSCSSAWKDFPNSIDREIRNRGWNRGSDWKRRSFNEGARAGMKEVLTEKEKECFRDSSEECEDLGNAAASSIAYGHCRIAMSRIEGGQSRRWKRDCRNAAINQCKGQVSAKVRQHCGARLRNRELLDLQGKCAHKVFDMINGRGEDNDYIGDTDEWTQVLVLGSFQAPLARFVPLKDDMLDEWGKPIKQQIDSPPDYEDTPLVDSHFGDEWQDVIVHQDTPFEWDEPAIEDLLQYTIQLAGSNWRATNIRGALISDSPDSQFYADVSLFFTSETSLEGHGGCNHFDASWENLGTLIQLNGTEFPLILEHMRVEDFVRNKMYCDGMVAQIENYFFSGLTQESLFYEFNGEELTLWDAVIDKNGTQTRGNFIGRFINVPVPNWGGQSLIGMAGEEAQAVIEAINPSLQVQVIPEGYMVTANHRLDRVRIFVGEGGNVTREPQRG